MKKYIIVALLVLTLNSCTNTWEKDNGNIIVDEEVVIEDKPIITENEEIVIDEEEITPEEYEFNNSWRAKAIESETDLWNFYSDDELGFSFNYPNDITLLAPDTVIDNSKIYIKVDLQDMQMWEWPMMLSKEDEMRNVEALSSWEFGIEQDFPLSESKKVKAVWNIFAQDFIVLWRFDVCDVVLERILLFYYDNKQITITLIWPKALINEKYIAVDRDNCWEDKVWSMDKQVELYNSLVESKENEDIQRWYNVFDEIAETITFEDK